MGDIFWMLFLALSVSATTINAAALTKDRQGILDEDGDRILEFPTSAKASCIDVRDPETFISGKDASATTINAAALTKDRQGILDEDGDRILEFPTSAKASCIDVRDPEMFISGKDASATTINAAALTKDRQGILDEDGDRILEFPTSAKASCIDVRDPEMFISGKDASATTINAAALTKDRQGILDEDGDRILEFPTSAKANWADLLNASRPVSLQFRYARTLGPRRPRPIPGWGG